MFGGVADTHAVIWYLYDDPRLSGNADTFIERAARRGEPIGVSSISLVEIIYLVEMEKIPSDTYERLIGEFNRTGTTLIEVPVDRQVADKLSTITRAAIPDMPDRIIAATALHLGVPLISRDGKIQVSGIQTIW